MANIDPKRYVTRFIGRDDADFADIWHHLECTSEKPCVFGGRDFAEAVAGVSNVTIRLAVVFDGDTPVCGFPLYESRRWGQARAAVPPFVPYTPLMGMLPSAAERHARRTTLERLLEATVDRYGEVALHLQPDIDDVRSWTWQGWRLSPLYTYVAGLQHPGGPLGAWSKNNRREFRNHRERFELGESVVDPANLAQLVKNSYARHARELPRDLDRLRAAIQLLVDRGRLRIAGARDKETEEVVAGCGVLCFEDRAAYWLAGSVPGPGMTVVIGALFEKLAKEGFETIDFVGANTPSIAEFKRKLGSELRLYFRAEATGSMLFRVADVVRSLR